MLNLKLHTPEGVMDYLPDACMAKRDIENRMTAAFESYAYRFIQTPAFEYHDLYTGISGDISSEKLFKFFDAQGHILALRGDVTTSIARVIATKWRKSELPARVCYVADAFRYNGSASTLPSEFTQAGIELIGDGSAQADAEVLIVTIEALLRAGLDAFQIDIGQVEFFKGLAAQVGLDEEDFEKIRMLIDHKDSLGIADIVEAYDVDPEIKHLMCQMPELFGGSDVLLNADCEKLNSRSKAALTNLREIYDIICACGLEQYVSIDLGMLQSIDYYTGVIFKGFTYDVGFAVCGGGRYDALLRNFGADREAVGMAISVTRVLSAMQRQKKPLKKPVTDAVCYMENKQDAGSPAIQLLRRQNIVLENYYGKDGMEQAIAYASSRGIHVVLAPAPEGKLTVIVDGQLKGVLMPEKVKEVLCK